MISWKGLLSVLVIFEVFTQSPLFTLYLLPGREPAVNLTAWHYLSVLGTMIIVVPLLLAIVPPLALVVGILTFLGFPVQ